MADTSVTLAGNATRDPELRYVASGQAVVSFGIAVNTRRRDGDRWVDGDPEFYDVTAWRDLAENVAATVTKGMRVMVIGRLQYRSWETDDGSKRSKVDIVADEVGPSLRWSTAQVERNERGGHSREATREYQVPPVPPAAGYGEPF